MRRSFSTEWLRPTALLLALTVASAPAVAGTLEASLVAEIDLAESSDLYLLLDTGSGTISIKARGLTLDGVEIRHLGLRAWGPLVGGATPLPGDLPPVLTITRSAPQRREIVVGGEPAASASADAAAVPAGLASSPATGSYACLLDNGWLLEVRDHGEDGPGFWRRLLRGLAHPFASPRGKRLQDPTLVVELSTADAERLRHLLRRDTAILVR